MLSWADTQPLWMQVFVGLALFFLGLPAALWLFIFLTRIAQQFFEELADLFSAILTHIFVKKFVAPCIVVIVIIFTLSGISVALGNAFALYIGDVFSLSLDSFKTVRLILDVLICLLLMLIILLPLFFSNIRATVFRKIDAFIKH